VTGTGRSSNTIGAQNYSGDIGTVWYDEVVVATQMVGCDYNP
jgi:hypothetical protein